MNWNEPEVRGAVSWVGRWLALLMTALLGSPAFGFEPTELILDTTTGLEWLAVGASIDRSYDDIVGVDGSNEFGPEGDFEGFRYATSAEVEALLARAAIDVPGGASVANFQPVQSLQLRFGGPTVVLEEVEDLFGITGTSAGEALQDRFVLQLDPLAGTGLAGPNGSVHSSAPNTAYGSFLVREAAPLPQRFAYVASFNSFDISIVDLATHTNVDSVEVGRASSAIAASPDGLRLYAVNTGDDSISVIDAVSRTVVDTFDVGAIPRDVVTSTDGERLFVSHRDVDAVYVLDAMTGALIKAIPVEGSAYGIARSPDGARVYLSVSETADVTVIDTTELTVVEASTTNSFQFALDVGERTGNIYSARSSTLYETDPDSLTEAASVTVGLDTRGVAVSEQVGRVFSSSNDDATVSVVDIASFSVLATIPTGAKGSIHNGSLAPGLAVTAAGDLVYVANGSDNTVSAIDTLSNEVVMTIGVTDGPADVAIVVPEPAAGSVLWLVALCTVGGLRRRALAG